MVIEANSIVSLITRITSITPITRTVKHIILNLFTTLCFLSINCVLHAQQTATIHGSVKDSLGNAIPAATIAASGTSAGVFTDNNGRYTLIVPAEQKVKIV